MVLVESVAATGRINTSRAVPVPDRKVVPDAPSAIMILFVSVSTPANVTKVPVVGRVSDVTPVVVRVRAWLPDLVRVATVLLATPVPPLAGSRTPVTPVDRGKPVTLVITPELGVPKAGVVNVGDVRVLFVRVWVAVVPTSGMLPPAGKENVVVPTARVETSN